MLTKSSRGLNLAQCVILYYTSKLTNSPIWNARHATTDFIMTVLRNGSDPAEKVLAFCANNHGVGHVSSEDITASLVRELIELPKNGALNIFEKIFQNWNYRHIVAQFSSKQH